MQAESSLVQGSLSHQQVPDAGCKGSTLRVCPGSAHALQIYALHAGLLFGALSSVFGLHALYEGLRLGALNRLLILGSCARAAGACAVCGPAKWCAEQGF